MQSMSIWEGHGHGSCQHGFEMPGPRHDIAAPSYYCCVWPRSRCCIGIVRTPQVWRRGPGDWREICLRHLIPFPRLDFLHSEIWVLLRRTQISRSSSSWQALSRTLPASAMMTLRAQQGFTCAQRDCWTCFLPKLSRCKYITAQCSIHGAFDSMPADHYRCQYLGLCFARQPRLDSLALSAIGFSRPVYTPLQSGA